MAPSFVTWQPAWHLARRHRSWRRARKYPTDAFLSARFVCSSVFAPSPPPPLGIRPPPRRRRRRLLSGHPHAHHRRRGRPSLRPLRPASSGEHSRGRPASSGEHSRGRPPRPPSSPGPPAAELPGHRAACSPSSGPGSSVPGHRAACSPPAAPSPAAARSLPAHCRHR